MDETARVELCNRLLGEVAAPWVQALGLRVVGAGDRTLELDAPVTPALVHGGGVVCGQALMAMADTAMVLALSADLGGFRPMTTVQLQTSFLKPVPGTAQSVRIRATVLRRGKSLAFGEIEMLTPDGSLAAHATTTYALL
jgi:uncharacterized protein (TIGR00369 family)